MPAADPANRRARSADQKAARRMTILAAAAEALAEMPYDAVTMDELVARTGLSKGTLYLYFSTREELFLALFDERLAAWSQAVIRGLPPASEREDVLAVLGVSAQEDRLFLPLLSRLAVTIAPRAPDGPRVASQRALGACMESVASHLCRLEGLPEDSAATLAPALATVLLGASQSAAALSPTDNARGPEAGLFSGFGVALSATLPMILDALRPD